MLNKCIIENCEKRGYIGKECKDHHEKSLLININKWRRIALKYHKSVKKEKVDIFKISPFIRAGRDKYGKIL